MVSPTYARFVVGLLGNIISLFLYLSPVPTFIRICKKGSVEQYSPTMYLVTFTNAMMWTLYGLPFVHPNSIWVLTISATGCLIELVYLLLFVIYSDNKKTKITVILITLAEIAVVAIALTLVLSFTHTTKLRSQVIGVLGDITSIVMYASPLSIMKQVITTKSVEFMPLAVSVTCFANAVVWTLYAILPFDPYVATPNGVGCLLGIAQLTLYATYYKTTKKQMAINEAAQKLEMGLKEVKIVTLGAQPSPAQPNKANNMRLK